MHWRASSNGTGEFIGVRELETQEPCSCALFTRKKLIVGCNKFFQIDLQTYDVDGTFSRNFPESGDGFLMVFSCATEFPEDDENSVKMTLNGVAKLGIFPVCVLNVAPGERNAELLLCYNEFGVFVDENGKRTRKVDPTWSHLPFAFGTIFFSFPWEMFVQ